MIEPIDVGGKTSIADMTYRTYSGPLASRRMRWWIVALAGLRASVKKKGFWVVAGLSLLPYLYVTVMLYAASRSQAMMGGSGARAVNNPMNPMAMQDVGQKYASNFLQAMQLQMFFLFLIALMTGAGVIAADQRTNALIVYLSKPITKLDYLVGKWMSIFVMLFSVSAIPGLLLYLYCLGSYASDGFLREEPLLIVRVLGASCIPAAIHASLLVGFSAWSRTPRMAGALYAGLYFLTIFVSHATWEVKYHGNMAQGILERHISILGAINGLAQHAYGVTQKVTMGSRRFGSMRQFSLTPPDLKVILALGLGLCIIGILAAYYRIRAVEVVRG